MGKIINLPPRHPDDDIVAELRAARSEVAAIRAVVDGMREMIERFVSQPQPRTWVTIDEAAALLHRTPQAVRFRCRRGLGVKVRGQWRIDRNQLRVKSHE